MPKHPEHHQELSRLNRVTGQLEGIKRMIEEQRYCVDILSQLRAVRNAVKTIELGVLERHVLNCLNEVACHGSQESRQKKMDEIMGLLKKYE
ncbi:metal-sensitive transcriptional regulator [Legionella pneumophila]|uniref:metal-sensitive transcriptional regulator n=1 Tax=Legionella pneumophila TaxID=446 RepID=UPI001A1D13F6|nr:metal-sensitive transcriptional regulator [Legionella pneumophila]MDG5851998.1 metal-sensitive transcriptional regulator [Legionella pneumophila]HAT7841703.1 metal-sensing transcriptional repressor [Legionella pneumophila]